MSRYKNVLSDRMALEEERERKQEILKKRNGINDDVYVKNGGILNSDVSVTRRMGKIISIVLIPFAVIGLYAILIADCRNAFLEDISHLMQFLGM